MDVADIDGHEALIAAIAAEHGRIWGLVNVAGIFIPEAVADLTVAAYRRQLGVMLDGPIWLARAAGLHMAAHGGGRIVNVTSIHATHSERTALSYDAAKGGLEAATRTLAIELGEPRRAREQPRARLRAHAHVGGRRPGRARDRLVSHGLRRERTAAACGRAAEPDEIAAVVAFLLSAENSYVSGARIVADGALTVGF